MEGQIMTPKMTIYRNIRLFVEAWTPKSLPMKMNRVVAEFYKFNPDGPVYVDPEELFHVLTEHGYVVDTRTGVISSRQ